MFHHVVNNNPSKITKLTTPLTTPFHKQYRTTTNKDQHALIVIISRLSAVKLVDVHRYVDPHIGNPT
ncbi:hypothetical protein EIG11_06030 [Escherichia coli]|nr:hypothetical protein [Escherichia coli]